MLSIIDIIEDTTVDNPDFRMVIKLKKRYWLTMS